MGLAGTEITSIKRLQVYENEPQNHTFFYSKCFLTCLVGLTRLNFGWGGWKKGGMYSIGAQKIFLGKSTRNHKIFLLSLPKFHSGHLRGTAVGASAIPKIFLMRSNENVFKILLKKPSWHFLDIFRSRT